MRFRGCGIAQSQRLSTFPGQLHFHVKGGGVEALVSIDPLDVIAGDLPAALRKEIFAWAATNKARLVTEWNTWNPNIPFAQEEDPS